MDVLIGWPGGDWQADRQAGSWTRRHVPLPDLGGLDSVGVPRHSRAHARPRLAADRHLDRDGAAAARRPDSTWSCGLARRCARPTIDSSSRRRSCPSCTRSRPARSAGAPSRATGRSARSAATSSSSPAAPATGCCSTPGGTAPTAPSRDSDPSRRWPPPVGSRSRSPRPWSCRTSLRQRRGAAPPAAGPVLERPVRCRAGRLRTRTSASGRAGRSHALADPASPAQSALSRRPVRPQPAQSAHSPPGARPLEWRAAEPAGVAAAAARAAGRPGCRGRARRCGSAPRRLSRSAARSTAALRVRLAGRPEAMRTPCGTPWAPGRAPARRARSR